MRNARKSPAPAKAPAAVKKTSDKKPLAIAYDPPDNAGEENEIAPQKQNPRREALGEREGAHEGEGEGEGEDEDEFWYSNPQDSTAPDLGRRERQQGTSSRRTEEVGHLTVRAPKANANANRSAT